MEIQKNGLETYVAPEMEIVCFGEENDIITDSGIVLPGDGF